MKGSAGFTLVEVLVAGFLLVLVLLGVVSMSLAAHGQLRRSGEQTAATSLVQQRIEWLRNQGYDATELAAGTTIETLTGTYVGYTRTTTVLADTPRAGVKQLTVTASTPSGRSFEVVSLIAE